VKTRSSAVGPRARSVENGSAWPGGTTTKLRHSPIKMTPAIQPDTRTAEATAVASSAWLGCVGLRRPVESMKPLAVYYDRYNGGKFHLLALGEDWAIVQWPWKGHIRKQRRSYLESARFKKL
jgi:hypothetical protein